MKGEDFTPKDKAQSFPDKTVSSTPNSGGVPISNIPRQKRKMKLVRKLSSKPAEQTFTVSDISKIEDKGLKFNAGSPSGTTPKLTGKQTKKLKNLSNKAAKAEDKYFKLEGKLPKRHKLKLTEKLPESKPKVQLHFEEQIKSPVEKLNLIEAPKALLNRSASVAGKAAFSGAVDGSSGQSDQEKALRIGAEKTVGTVVEGAKNTVLAPAHFLGWRNQRKHEKFEKTMGKTVKAHTKSEYHKYRFERMAQHKSNPLDSPKPATNPISRALQKRRFMKEYRKSLKESSQVVGRSVSQKLVHLTNGITKNLKKIGLVAVAIVLAIVSIGSCMQGIGLSTTGIFKGIFSTTYPAGDKELSDADWYFSDLEAGLVNQIETAAQNHPTYDEYNYFLNGNLSDKQSLIIAVGHDPFKFLSFISVMHEDFKFSEIKGALQEFFNVVFQLELETVTQTRYRTVTDDEGNETEEPYTYYILNTRLTIADWDTVVQPFIDSKDGARQYEEYINSGGNHQMFGTPFNFDWYSQISCHYGGRDNPTGANTGSTTASGQEMHTGLDIAVSHGTPIYSIMEGTVTFSGWHNLYGNYIDVTDKNGNKSRYAHCSRLLLATGQEVKLGQAIAEVGSTGNSTGAHLHLEIFLGGTRVNPLFLVKYKPEQ